MSRIYVDDVLPETSGIGETLNLGAAGDNVIVPTGATLKTNKLFDAGGNNVITSDGSGNLTINGGMSGSPTLLATNTISNAAESIFTSTHITTSYSIYYIAWHNVIPVTNHQAMFMRGSQNNGSSYAVEVFSTFIHVHHRADGAGGALSFWDTGSNNQGSTAGQYFTMSGGNSSGNNSSGELWLLDPMDVNGTQRKKHWLHRATTSGTDGGQGMYACYSEGMWESSGVSINNIKFSFGSGNIASGIFKLYGIE